MIACDDMTVRQKREIEQLENSGTEQRSLKMNSKRKG